MSLVLKSNKVATASLGNINGILGKQDWVAFFDFENGQYIKKLNNVKSELQEAEVLTCNSNKSLEARPMTIDRLGNKSVITAVNQLRWWQAQERYGLLIESEQTNWFVNSSAPATQTISNIPAGSLMIVSCVGSGSLIVSGAGIQTTTVIEGSPFAIPPVSSIRSINIEVVGSLIHAQVIRAAGFATLHTPIYTSSASRASGADLVEINQSLVAELIDKTKPVTIVYQTLPVADVADPRPSYSESRIVIETSSLTAAAGLTKTGNEKLANRLVSSNKSNSTYQSTGSGAAQNISDIGKINTQAIQFLSNGSVFAMQGGELYKPTAAIGLNQIEKIKLASGVVSPVHQGGNCIFTKLAIYNRLLSDAEILQISKSWL